MNKVHKYIHRYRYRNGAVCIMDIGPFINADRFISCDGFLAIRFNLFLFLHRYINSVTIEE